MPLSAAEVIRRLSLQPHPEGGHYAETYRASAADGQRPAVTLIHFLLQKGERSHWHRVDADEIWCWHAGSPAMLSRAPGAEGPLEHVRLGGDLAAGEVVQQVIPAGWWQAAHADRGWALFSCIVAPGFDFAGFQLAPPGWEPAGAP